MKHRQLAGAIVSCLVLIACVPVPVRQDSASLQTAVAQSAAGAPRLPGPGESYLDAAWFEQTLTVDRAVQAALLNNPSVRGELSRLDAAHAERVQAGLLRNPMTTLMALRPEGGGRYELDYNLMQSLFDLFTRSRRIEAADAAQRRTEAEVLVRLLALAQDSEAAYYDALAAQARLNLQREQLALDEETLLLLQRQAKQGAVPTSVALEQEGMTATRAHEVRLSEAEFAQARGALAQQLGLSSATNLRLPDSLDPPVVAGLDGPALQALAASHRPELRAAQAGVDQASTELGLQSGAPRATDPSLGLAGVRETDGFWMNGLELQITIPVFDTGRARGDLARARIVQAEAEAESIRRQVPLDVERALATLAAAQVATEHADHHLRQQALLEELARKNYLQGNADLPRFRQATQARLLAAIDQVNSRQAQWSALIALQRTTGVAAAGR